MSAPLIGRNAVVTYTPSGGNATVIGFAMGVISHDINVDLIKEFKYGSDKPAILASGNKHFKFTIGKMFVDETYATLVYSQAYTAGGSGLSLVFAPAGTATGKPKITITNVVLTAYNWQADQKGIVSEKVQGEGTDYQIGNF